jgi:hypothetical protein
LIRTVNILIFIFGFGCQINSLNAQVEVAEKIILTGTTDTERQIKNLHTPNQQDAGVSAIAVQKNQVSYGVASGVNTLNISLPIQPTGYTSGLKINFLSTDINTGSVQINVNNLGNVNLLKNGNLPLDSAEILAGQIVTVIYDGQNFQVISKLNQPCPSGFVDVNADFCIQTNEQDSASFWDAILHCGSLNAELCNWNDWYIACANAANLSIMNITGNWEWINDGGNNSASAVPLTSNTAHIVGNPNCENRFTGDINNSNGIVLRTYRCCYRK